MVQSLMTGLYSSTCFLLNVLFASILWKMITIVLHSPMGIPDDILEGDRKHNAAYLKAVMKTSIILYTAYYTQQKDASYLTLEKYTQF